MLLTGLTTLLPLLLLALALTPRAAVAQQIDEAQFQKDLEAIASQPRIIGSEGYEAAARYLEEQIKAMPGVELRRHDFPVVVPVTKSATLTLPDGKVEKVHPFWPANIRHNATGPEGIRGKLTYIGKAKVEQIKPRGLDGQIAVVESESGGAWVQAAYFGARAVIVLGFDEDNNVHMRAHESWIPVNIPRFYVPAGELAERLRRGEISGEATVKAEVNWERKTAHNYYALVQSPLLRKLNELPAAAQWAVGATVNPAPEGWTAGSAPAALMFSVPFESSGLVPDLAFGASQAAQTAAGLALLRDLSRQPLNRPAMVFFGGADSIQFLATRNMFMALSDVPQFGREELETLVTKETAVAADLARARQVLADPSQLIPAKDRSLVERIIKIIETDAMMHQDELFRLRMGRAENKDPARIKVLETEQILLNRLRYAFQQNPRDLVGELREPAQRFVQRVIVRMDGAGTPGEAGYRPGLTQQYAERRQQVQTRIDLYRWLADRLHRNPDPDKGANNNRLIEVLVALDLSDHGVRFGPMYFGQFQRSSNISQIQDYRDWFDKSRRQYEDVLTAERKDAEAAQAGTTVQRTVEEAKELQQKKEASTWYAQVQDVFDFEPLNGARAAQTWLCASMPIGSELCQAWGVPGFTLMTLDDLRLVRDTPTDTLANLDTKPILAQLRGVRALMWQAWNDPKFKGQPEWKWLRMGFEGQVVSPAPGRPVPDLPREGFLATYYYLAGARTIPNLRWYIPYTLGIRRNEIRDCDAEGNYRFEGLPRLNEAEMELLGIQVYRVEENTGRVTACSDLGKQTGDIKQSVDIRQDVDPIRSLVFNCTEFTLVGLHDPRFLQDLAEVTLLDARRNADPQRYNLLLGRQMCAGFVEPDMNSYLVFRYGRVGNRLLLLNMAGEGQAKVELPHDETRVQATGFSVAQLNSLGPVSLVTAKDFYDLDEERLSKYAKAGVSNSLLNELHQEAKDRMESARAAREADDGMQMVKDANGAWASEARVYLAAQDMANDVIRGTIFLLLLCVPFAFCMERLLIGTPNIYKQITYSFAFFAVMTAALWSFHPAFKISSSPLIVVLAFAIIFMSVVVISVVYSKFDTELKRIRSGKGSGPTSASFARASVLMSAVLLGIANMRKRKFRTALTSITIVLITFAVLCFTSASRYLDTTTLPTGVSTNGNHGIMMRQRGFRVMPTMVLDNLQAVLPGRQIVERWWNINAGDPKDQFHVVAPQPGAQPKIFVAQAVLGLSPGENKATPVINQIIGAEKVARLDDERAKIIYLSRNIAEQLGVAEGQSVKLAGIDLEVAGIFDANEFDQKMIALSGEPIAPLKYNNGALDAAGRRLDNSWEAEALDVDAGASQSEVSGSGAYEHLSATQFVIVPRDISRMLPNSSLRTVAFKLKDDAEVKQVSDELAKRFAIAMFAGFTDGVRMVAASNLASVSGAGQVAVPLAIAGLIIFNTMMGSIAERRREIHVYTSLGLAPLHVGALFLAEAMTYGLIGTVFGYVIGQGMGTAMLKLGWLGSVTLNYSGTSAMMTMGLILLIVLLSALVPARLASKIAAPSIDRTWKVPLPKGDEIIAHLPFTINKTAADGALAYLADFFDAHQEGSIGKFSAGKVEVFNFADESERVSRGLKTVIWLTPFDLGVRQHLMLLIHPGQYEDIYEVQVVLQRLSGDDGSWYRMNRSFLTELRKQFLQWRSLSPQRMLQYVEESKRLFAEQASSDAVVHVNTGVGAASVQAAR